MSRAKTIEAAGCVPWRRDPGSGAIEIAVVHRAMRQDWSLPKGKLDHGESWPAAAVREVEEETGIRVTLGPPLPALSYSVEGIPKEVRYWAAAVQPERAKSARFTPNQEIDEVRWIRASDAPLLLSYPQDCEVVRALVALIERCEDAEPDLLIVLRHARAMKRRHWRGADADRPLHERGDSDAEALVPVLSAYGVDSIHSSNTARCLATVEPYALAKHLDVSLEPRVSERGHRQKPSGAARRTAALLAEGGRAVLCSHRPVIPAILQAAVGDAATSSLIGEGLPPASLIVIHHLRGDVFAVERHDLPR